VRQIPPCPAPSKFLYMSVVRTTSVVLAGFDRSTCWLPNNRSAPGAGGVVVAAGCSAGIGRDHTVLVDLQLLDEDRRHALLEVDERQLLPARRRRVLHRRWVIERIAFATMRPALSGQAGHDRAGRPGARDQTRGGSRRAASGADPGGDRVVAGLPAGSTAVAGRSAGRMRHCRRPLQQCIRGHSAGAARVETIVSVTL
jgi:hypothetical protein